VNHDILLSDNILLISYLPVLGVNFSVSLFSTSLLFQGIFLMIGKIQVFTACGHQKIIIKQNSDIIQSHYEKLSPEK
jgi:hypothetical protein